MTTTALAQLTSKDNKVLAKGLSTNVFSDWMREIEEQPAWRTNADKESDYYDGNQLDSAILQEMHKIGMPPAIEPVIGPTIDAVLGMEAKARKDYRVVPATDVSGDEVALALNQELNQAERHSKADRACSEAYAGQIKVGLGWVEVSRDSNPFSLSKYRCRHVHRNEIWWDWLSREPDLSDARYLIRRRWTDIDIAQVMFPKHAALIDQVGTGWAGFTDAMLIDGGSSTDLAMYYGQERGWSLEEMEWRDIQARRVCLFEVWYRVYERAIVFRLPDGRVIELDKTNPLHLQAISMPNVEVIDTVVPRVRMAWMLGPYQLHDGPSPYRHPHFPYVPFWGKREDRTGVPYGLIRGMLFLQDEINARIAKMHWGLAAVRTTRTDGAVIDDDEVFRNEVARIDADIKLNREHMAEPGARFEVDRDYQLNQQQADRLREAREAISRVGGITESFEGRDERGRSGLAINALVEQSVQALADINDNFEAGRMQVGELLLNMIIEDLSGREEQITVTGGIINDDKIITLNHPQIDPETGIEYRTNNTEQTRLRVALAEVPSTPSFRAQQLAAMSEAFKSMPEKYQTITLPYLVNLMDIPNKEEIVEAVRQVSQMPTPEEIQAQVDEAVEEALVKAQVAEKQRALDIKEREADSKIKETDAKIEKTVAETVQKTMEAFFSGIQGAREIMLTPGVAPVADELYQSAGGIDKNGPPIAEQPAVTPIMPEEVQPAGRNTSPNFPARTQQPEMEQPVVEEPMQPENPAVGDNRGIEQAGAQG